MGRRHATVEPLASTDLNISAFGEDRDGELYIVDYWRGAIHRLRRPQDAEVGEFPLTLSATGCFDDLATRHPAPGLLPYDVQSPLWSDGEGKRRFLVLPDGATIGHHIPGAWEFPAGTILVKEFTFEQELGNAASERALETRFLIRRENGWAGYTYQWNEAQTEAYLLDGAATATFAVSDPAQPGVALEHPHYFPSRSDCGRCHTAAAGGTLGLQTAQLNRVHDYGGVLDNQLRAWEHVGLFGGCLPARPANLPRLVDPSNPAGTLDARAQLSARQLRPVSPPGRHRADRHRSPRRDRLRGDRPLRRAATGRRSRPPVGASRPSGTRRRVDPVAPGGHARQRADAAARDPGGGSDRLRRPARLDRVAQRVSVSDAFPAQSLVATFFNKSTQRLL